MSEIEAWWRPGGGACAPATLAPKTVKTYGESADQLAAHLAKAGVTSKDDITRDHVAAFITWLLVNRSAATASVRYRALQQFFT